MYDHILLEAPTLPSGVRLADVVEDAAAQEVGEVLAPMHGLLSEGGRASAEQVVESGERARPYVLPLAISAAIAPSVRHTPRLPMPI